MLIVRRRLDLRGTVGFFASRTESVTVTSDNYYSFPLRVGSDAIQYRIEGAMKRTEKWPQIPRVRVLDAVTRLSPTGVSDHSTPSLGLCFCISTSHAHVVHGFLNSMLAHLT